MMKNLKHLLDDKWIHYSIILLVSILVITPVFFAGIPYVGADFVHHMQISNAFYEALRDGILFPDWVSRENLGYGAVTVRFYPPSMDYTLAVFRLITGSWSLAIFGAFSFWSFIGGVGVYIWTREFLKTAWHSTLAAVLFICAPYHLTQYYASYMFGEFAALSVLPFCFHFAKKICEREKIGDVLGLAISAALIILSNLPQTIISFIALGIYVLFFLRKPIFLKQIFRLTFAGLLALACSAFYWVRMIVEMDLIHVTQPNTDPIYDYRNHFMLSNFSFDTQNIWFASLMFVIVVFGSGFALVVSGKAKSLWRDKNLKSISIIGLMAIFMMLAGSKFIWENITFLQRVQFPWRFFSVLSLCTSVILAYCAEFVTLENLRKKRPLILILVGLILILLTFSIKQVIFGQAFFEISKFPAYVEGTITQRSLKHWLPVWADKNTFNEKTKVLAKDRNVNIEMWESGKRIFTVSEGEPIKARIAILYYPHWHAFINGEAAEISASDDGATAIDLPPSAAKVELVFIEPQYSLLSRKISVIATIFAFLLFIYQLITRRKSNAE